MTAIVNLGEDGKSEASGMTESSYSEGLAVTARKNGAAKERRLLSKTRLVAGSAGRGLSQ